MVKNNITGVDELKITVTVDGETTEVENGLLLVLDDKDVFDKYTKNKEEPLNMKTYIAHSLTTPQSFIAKTFADASESIVNNALGADIDTAIRLLEKMIGDNDSVEAEEEQ